MTGAGALGGSQTCQIQQYEKAELQIVALEFTNGARKSVIAAITQAAPATVQFGPVADEIMLRTSLGQITNLMPGEKHLLSELLDRIAKGKSS